MTTTPPATHNLVIEAYTTHLEHDVVLEIGNEVHHLVLAQVALMKHASNPGQLLHRMKRRQMTLPRVNEHVLQPLDLEQQRKHLEILVHGRRGDDDIQRVGDIVVQAEDLFAAQHTSATNARVSRRRNWNSPRVQRQCIR